MFPQCYSRIASVWMLSMKNPIFVVLGSILRAKRSIFSPSGVYHQSNQCQRQAHHMLQTRKYGIKVNLANSGHKYFFDISSSVSRQFQIIICGVYISDFHPGPLCTCIFMKPTRRRRFSEARLIYVSSFFYFRLTSPKFNIIQGSPNPFAAYDFCVILTNGMALK